MKMRAPTPTTPEQIVSKKAGDAYVKHINESAQTTQDLLQKARDFQSSEVIRWKEAGKPDPSTFEISSIQ